MEVMDDPTGNTSQHNFAHARVFTSGDARFNSVAGNMSVYENCVFSRGLQADEAGDRARETTLSQRICKWLGDVNFDSIYSESLSEGTEGTGMWFIQTEEFRRWAEGDLKVLWGTGKPGAGKTILSSIIINYLQNLDSGEEVPVIYAYCRYSEKYSATQIFSSMVKQFLEHDQSAMKHISQYFLSHEKDDSALPTTKQLLQFLSSISMTYDRIFIVLDGLDEAEESDRQQLLDGLNSLPSNMHSLIMSRPLKSFEYLIPGAAFLDIQARNEDIERFVEKRIDETPTLRAVLRGKDAAKDQLCAAIKEKSHGMFLVARLQVEALKECINVKSLMAKLGELPTGVNDLYLHTLDRIESQDPEKALLAKRTFLWVAYAFETLKTQQLQEALAVSLELETFDEDSIITEELIHDVCCGLISLDFFRGVRFIHYTTRDFLRGRCSSWFQRPHATLTSSCVIYLSSTKPPSFRDLTRYAAGHWGSHARLASEEESELPRHVSEFLLKIPNHRWPSLDHRPYGNGWIIPEPISSGHLAAFLGLKSYLSRHIDDSAVTPRNRFTFLHMAAIGGHVDTAEAILQKWPALSPHDSSAEDKTPFMLASGCGHTSILEFFLSISSKDHHLLNSKASCGCTALACAVRQNQPSALKVLVSFPAIDVNATACDTGLTPLAWAARTGDAPVVKLLLSNPDLNVNVRNPLNGYTALFEACFQDNVHIVKLLTSHPDLDVNLGPYCGCTPLIMSVYCQREAVIPYLLNHPRINLHARCLQSGPALAPRDSWPSDWVSELILTDPRLFTNASHADIQFCLERAAELGLESTVKEIISKYLVPANLRLASSVLVEAAKAGQLSIVETLLEVADVNAVDDVGCTGLAGAATRGHLNVVALLLSREDILVNQGSYPPLIAASKRGYTPIVRLLLDHQSIDVNVQDKDGHVSLAWAVDAEHWDVVDMLLATPAIDVNRGTCPVLIKACSKGRDNLVQELLEREGIDLNAEDAEGWSPIACAAFLGHESICSILVDRPEVKLTGGRVSPFVQAAAGGSEAVVRLLLSQVPRCNPNDIDGEYTPLSMAARWGFTEIVQLLVSRLEVDVNQGSPTPLMQACICGHSEIVRVLLSCCTDGLNVNAQDERHVYHPTALWFACYSLNGSSEIVQLLLKRFDIDVNLGLTPTDTADLPTDRPSSVVVRSSTETTDSVGSGYIEDQYLHFDDPGRLSTPLHAACVHRPRAVQMLLAAPGIDVTRSNEYGETALAMLLNQDRSSEGLEVADYFLSHPATLASDVGHNLLVYVAGFTASRSFEEEAVLSIMKKILLLPGQMMDINLQPVSHLNALSAACSSGSIRVVNHLLSLPTIDPNCGTPPPLVQASIFGNVEILAMLLRHPQTDPNIETTGGYTALGESCAQFNLPNRATLKSINLLLSCPGVDVNAGRHSPLSISVRNEHVPLVELLLDHPDINVNCRISWGLRSAHSSSPSYEILESNSPSAKCHLGLKKIGYSDFNETQACVKRRRPYALEPSIAHDPFSWNIDSEMTSLSPSVERLDTSDEACDPLLVYCTRFGPPQVVELLLRRDDLDVNATESCGCTALIWASRMRKDPIIDALLGRKETSLDTRCLLDGCSALLAAAHRMNFQVVHKFLSHPRSYEIDSNAFAACGCNLLVCVSRSGDEDTVRSILPRFNWSLYPNAQDCQFGRTALLWASYFGQDTLVRLFLSQPNISIHHRDKRGNTALMLAAEGGHDDVVRSLLASPRLESIDASNSNGDTAMTLAVWGGCIATGTYGVINTPIVSREY